MHGRLRLCALFLVVLVGCGPEPVSRIEWLQMGTVAAIQTRGPLPADQRDCVQTVLTELEALLDAHRESSELSQLAALADEDVVACCSEAVRPCYAEAFALTRLTGGAFNPRWRGAGTLDLGAIAKGFAVDEAARRLKPTVPTLLDLGGNLKAVRGDWTIGIREGEVFVLPEGAACATSARYFRGDHIHDARTGGVVTNALYSVTVVHPTSAMLADGLSTVLFILGREKGTDFLRTHFPEAEVHWLSQPLP